LVNLQHIQEFSDFEYRILQSAQNEVPKPIIALLYQHIAVFVKFKHLAHFNGYPSKMVSSTSVSIILLINLSIYVSKSIL
jgi:hypothetical protein